MRMPRRYIVFDYELIDIRPGFITLALTGDDVQSFFAQEAGGHRWQRIPPTEKRGRVQTSTVTVAVLNVSEQITGIDMRDVNITVSRGSGPGGQHRNKTESCVTATHIPTGLTAKADLRSQHRSKAVALQILSARVLAAAHSGNARERDKVRREQTGTGMRGDKIRTYRVQDDTVTDHRTGHKMRLSDWINGRWHNKA